VPAAAPVSAPAPAPAQPALAAGAARHAAACEAAFAAGHWRAAGPTCAAAFAEQNDARVALRAAHAFHRRGHLDQAGDWARRALALDDQLAEAHVIVAHAATDAGHAGEAAAAYRRYLELAPRGWHAPEARRALAATEP
jgi:tetratricopeptide (TPR) repeat protein